MQEKFKKHIWYYVIFVVVELAGLAALLYLATDAFLRLIVIILMTLFYVFWSILHHSMHHSVTKKIVLEYILIGLLGIVVVWFFLQ